MVTTPSTIERLAQIVHDTINPDWEGTIERDNAIHVVRKLLGALREPSEAMIRAGDYLWSDWEEMRTPTNAWHAMIDALLAENVTTS